MDEIKQALYQQMRFSILITASRDREASPFSDAYLYAWDRGVYPLHDGGEWHVPHEKQFRVRETEIEELNLFLAKRWDDKQPITFYELEDHYDARSSGPWDRPKLIFACRFISMHDLFDKICWHELRANGKCPTEANAVIDSHPDRLFFH